MSFVLHFFKLPINPLLHKFAVGHESNALYTRYLLAIQHPNPNLRLSYQRWLFPVYQTCPIMTSYLEWLLRTYQAPVALRSQHVPSTIDQDFTNNGLWVSLGVAHLSVPSHDTTGKMNSSPMAVGWMEERKPHRDTEKVFYPLMFLWSGMPGYLAIFFRIFATTIIGRASSSRVRVHDHHQFVGGQCPPNFGINRQEHCCAPYMFCIIIPPC